MGSSGGTNYAQDSIDLKKMLKAKNWFFSGGFLIEKNWKLYLSNNSAN